MNATFVLLTAAWFAGDAPAGQQPAATTPAPAVVAAPAHGCGGCCDACCDCCEESWGKKAWGRLRGMFSKKDCCDCCEPCCAPAPCCTPCCEPCCGDVEGWWGRVKGMFRKKGCDDCCDCGCGCGAHGGTVIGPAPAGPAAKPAEQIPAPGGAKEMPKGEATSQLLIPRPISPTSGLSIR